MVRIRVEDLETYAYDNKVPIMQKDGIDFLTKYIKDNNIKNILEVGSAIGYSSIKMALVDSNIKITTLERDKKMYDIACENIEKFNLDNQIHIINEDALDVELNDIYDLIFLDGAKGQYINFFEKFDKNLKLGGVVITDNLSFHGLVDDITKTNNRNTKQLVRKIKKYIEYLKSNTFYETTFYKLGDGISVSIKKGEI